VRQTATLAGAELAEQQAVRCKPPRSGGVIGP